MDGWMDCTGSSQHIHTHRSPYPISFRFDAKYGRPAYRSIVYYVDIIKTMMGEVALMAYLLEIGSLVIFSVKSPDLLCVCVCVCVLCWSGDPPPPPAGRSKRERK
jgi:hypothetical protein